MKRLPFAVLPMVFMVVSIVKVPANVSVTNAFSNNMVLQRNMAVPVWGKASSGESVTVTLNGQSKTVTTPSNGSWTIKLDPMPEGGPYTMTIKGNNTLTKTGVYIGEVWQCAGQSNVDTRLNSYTNLADSIANANIPLLRYYTLRQGSGDNSGNKWEIVSPSTAGQLSALGYFFGKEIQKITGLAVGLVVTAVGGTTIASWFDPATLTANPGIKDTDKGTMWDSWVAPVVGYGIKGTVWVQGEQNCNASDAPTYGDRFKLLIKGWRAAWGQGDFPFYFGQLSSTSGTPDPNNVSYVAQVREGQRLALALPNTTMSVFADIGSGGWHFPNKPEAGMRLSLAAKALLYGQTNVEYSGPMYSTKSIDGAKVKLLFSHIGGGLTVQNGSSLSGFAIAAASGNWVWGDAMISGDTVIVTSSSVTKPTRVRYAWSDYPVLCLFNKAGLPASPFTTESPDMPQVGTIDRQPLTLTNQTAYTVGAPNLFRFDALGRRVLEGRMAGPRIVWQERDGSAYGTFVLRHQP